MTTRAVTRARSDAEAKTRDAPRVALRGDVPECAGRFARRAARRAPGECPRSSPRAFQTSSARFSSASVPRETQRLPTARSVSRRPQEDARRTTRLPRGFHVVDAPFVDRRDSQPLRRHARPPRPASSVYRDPTTVVLRTADDAKVPFETIRLSAVESTASEVRPTHICARVVVGCGAPAEGIPSARARVFPA